MSVKSCEPNRPGKFRCFLLSPCLLPGPLHPCWAHDRLVSSAVLGSPGPEGEDSSVQFRPIYPACSRCPERCLRVLSCAGDVLVVRLLCEYRVRGLVDSYFYSPGGWKSEVRRPQMRCLFSQGH